MIYNRSLDSWLPISEDSLFLVQTNWAKIYTYILKWVHTGLSCCSCFYSLDSTAEQLLAKIYIVLGNIWNQEKIEMIWGGCISPIQTHPSHKHWVSWVAFSIGGPEDKPVYLEGWL